MTADTSNNTPSGCDLPTNSRSDTIKALEAIRDLEHLPGWDVVERVLRLENLAALAFRLLRGSWDDAVDDARQMEATYRTLTDRSIGQPWPSAPTALAEPPQADSEAPAPDNCPSGGCSFVPTPAPDDNV
jgi:hypothetical protein